MSDSPRQEDPVASALAAPVAPGEPYPIDPELASPAVKATAEIEFQSYPSGIADERLSTAFAGLADRLLDAALELPASR
ncbi:MAG: hypothetical protein WKF40_04880 [Thermoleophilaceae bacterium]